MGKQSQHSFKKRQREVERLQKAKKKMAKRQGKKDSEEDSSAADKPDQP